MQVAIFGLGKMGAQIARRLHNNQFNVLAWNRSNAPREEVAKSGVKVFAGVSELVSEMSESPRIFWLMLPHAIVDDFLFGKEHLGPHLKRGDIVIDGGNSFYKDSVKRAQLLKANGIYFFDCGTSGGVWGEKEGFAQMIGGPKEVYSEIESIFKTLSSGNNYGLVGDSGAGHFVKMVHNGIEYGMMEAIGEGYAIMHASQFKPDLKLVTQIYQKGSVVRSWLIDLMKNIYDNEDVEGTSGFINATGEGEWTIKAAKELGVDARVIEDAFKVRQESKDEENQNKYSNKLVALLRKQFGGHEVKKNE
ncbi:MAG: 6-phosphogluconate dehydrogenase (decarboxylating) [Candidatus Doudnabacteria bacterium CG10_big_fil_rev_8_21_14_0_10_42_18]|uniref:6-phosphogluconate dehydrogenase (Decarboxylating) n=1 Tax=Candidatus Doudnabacteria bacterium CG10_big_fil_rev_8_21_14_0_10_42_18 TaxID=1974552 RepID=A0A2H0VAT0_9BACT|nr:MAG: 6-phosphogluconate dehydrogenase (decarboxylating) [Candidatus Doudnabacteria bacterium CG10_big_fil_rev_8_21_14_0_10_42_18]